MRNIDLDVKCPVKLDMKAQNLQRMTYFRFQNECLPGLSKFPIVQCGLQSGLQGEVGRHELVTAGSHSGMCPSFSNHQLTDWCYWMYSPHYHTALITPTPSVTLSGRCVVNNLASSLRRNVTHRESLGNYGQHYNV